MPITKILIQYDTRVGDELYDVLLPLPANVDACMKAIGIENFDDADDKWDEDFLNLLRTLVG